MVKYARFCFKYLTLILTMAYTANVSKKVIFFFFARKFMQNVNCQKQSTRKQKKTEAVHLFCILKRY